MTTRNHLIPTVIALLATSVLPAGAAAQDLEPRVAASRATVKQFMTSLQSELQAAMQAGGPLNAIAVCNEKAPKIAAQHSEKFKGTVGRTSLKTRNESNAPDAWERSVLERFEARKAKGEDPAKLEHYEVVKTADGKSAFRYMKAIPTGKVCLNCHGADINPAVAAKLDKLYPNDKARGFKEGDLRGAFTLSQPL